MPTHSEVIERLCAENAALRARCDDDRQAMLVAYGSLQAAATVMPGAAFAAGLLRDRLYPDDANQPAESEATADG